MSSIDIRKQGESAENLQPNLTIVIGGSLAIGFVSLVTLPGPVAIASIVLGVAMLAGADIDARTYLLAECDYFRRDHWWHWFSVVFG